MVDPQEVFGRVGIVGAGGGFRGTTIPPLVEAILERGIKIDYLGGVSVSALVLAKLSEAGKQEDLRPLLNHVYEIWRSIEIVGPQAVFPPPHKWHIWNKQSFADSDPLFRLLQNFDPKKSVASPIRFDVFVKDDETKQHLTLSNRDQVFVQNPEFLRSAVVASASIRPFFPPVEVAGRFYYDGGFITLRGAIDHGCDTIFVLFPYTKEYSKPAASRDWFEKHFPSVSDSVANHSVDVRLLDVRALEDADRHNEKVGYKRKLGMISKFVDKISEIKDEVLSALSVDQGKPQKLVKVIPVYAEYPETLSLAYFEKGDFAAAHKKCREIMNKELDKLLK